MKAVNGVALALTIGAVSAVCPENSFCPLPQNVTCESFSQCECEPAFDRVDMKEICVPAYECPEGMIKNVTFDGYCCHHTLAPTAAPSVSPTLAPSNSPTNSPSAEPTVAPTTEAPTGAPTTEAPTGAPSVTPTGAPSTAPSSSPTSSPSEAPTTQSPAPSEAPTMQPTEGPTQAPVFTIPPSTSAPTTVVPSPSPQQFNLTCEVWGDPHVDCFSGNQFSLFQYEDTNLTVFYEMDDRFKVIGELNETLVPTDDGFKWVTYTENVYVWFEGKWEHRISARDCRLQQLRPTSTARSDGPIIRASSEYEFPETGEYIMVDFSCPQDEAGRLDTKINKLNPATSSEGALQWELEQPGYDGNCLVCGGAPFDGEVPRTGSTLQVAHEGFEDFVATTRSDDLNQQNSALSTSAALLVTLVAIFAFSF